MRGSWACDLLHMFSIFIGTNGVGETGGADVSPMHNRQQSVPTERSEER